MSLHVNLSIRKKIQGIVIVASGAALLMASVVFTLYDRSTFLHAKAQDLNTSATMVGSNSTAALSFGDVKSAREILSALQAKQHVIYACIYDKDGKPFATYSREPGRIGVASASTQNQAASIVGRNMIVFQPIVLNGESIGTIFIEEDLADIRQRTSGFAEIALLIFLASLAVSFLLSSRLQRVISGPIRELAKTASSVSAHEDYSVRAKKRGNDEIGFLFDQFNSMLDRIQHRDVALQQAHDNLEKRVEERTAYLNALIENTPLGIVAIGTDDCVQICNPAFEHLFGYSLNEIVGQPLSGLLSSAEIFSEVTSNQERLRQSKPAHMVTRRKRRDGTMVDVEAFAVPLRAAGTYTGAVLIYQDITERKHVEDALLLAKELAEAASRAKSEFLANMSHEIRTPMNGIIGLTELVLDTKLDKEQRNYLSLAKISADSLLSLINDILDYSKIEAGKLDIDAIEFNLVDSLGETMKTLSLRAHQKGLELAFEIKPNVPDSLVGDPGRLRQIVINLVGNAIKFTERGEVVLQVDTESATEDEVLLHFIVIDTGIGISAAKQGSIFEAFKQADGSMTREYGGTGLGLTISSRLVELMGGRIWVESQLGQGSRFHFILRFVVQKPSARTTLPNDAKTLRDMRVLIVDDNATNRQILLKMAESWHMAPTAVDSGASALVCLGEAKDLERPFLLILLDAHMPDMDGFTLAAAIKSHTDWKPTTVMMLSSAGQGMDALRCSELGVAAYLTKPVRRGELLDAILSALGTPAEQETSSPIILPALARRNPLRVLLVEDNAVNQLVALRLLERYGHVVRVAVNGKKALEALETDSYDVVLMDVQMPEMNGWQATQAIRDKERTTGEHIPIIAMTAHVMKGDEERCLAAGMDSYLTKPIRVPELLAQLDGIGNHKFSPPTPLTFP
jgi:two-component system, sensor histidine kinase and response regulator